MHSRIYKYLNPKFTFLLISILLHFIPIKVASQLLFNRRYDIKNHHNDAHNIIESFDDGYIFTGTDYNDSIVGNLMYQISYVSIYSLDCCGKIDWLIKYHPQGYALEVGSSSHIVKTYDSCYVITGAIISLTDSTWDCFVIKINRLGNILWSKIIGRPAPFNDVLRAGLENPDSTITFCGLTGIFDSYEKVWMVKMDTYGNILMQDSSGSNLYYLDVRGIVVAPDKGYIMCGSRQNNFNYIMNYYLLKTDSNFNKQWDVGLGSNHSFTGLTIVNDSLIFAVGYYIPNQYYIDAFLSKFSPSGIPLMSKTFSADQNYFMFTTSPIVNDDSTLVIGGITTLELPVYTISGFLFRTNVNGDSLQFKMFHKFKSQELYFLSKTSDGKFAACGYTGKASSSIPGGIQDAWAFVTDSLFNDSATACAIPYSTVYQDGSFLVYPQPTVNSVTIKFPIEIKTDAIIITDIKGTIVYKITPSPFEQHTFYFNRNSLSAGIYLVNYRSKGNWHYGCKILFVD